MALFGWFTKNKKSTKAQVTEQRQNVLQDTAVAAAFAEAGEHETARIMIDKAAGNRKVLVVGRADSFSEGLVEYSLGMAKRLDFEIVAVNITDAPLSLSVDKREEAIELFRQNSMKNVTALKELAEKNGVQFSHVVEIGHQDEVVDTLHAKYPGMRYVLTEPDSEVVKKANGKVDIPVFDLGAYQGEAA